MYSVSLDVPPYKLMLSLFVLVIRTRLWWSLSIKLASSWSIELFSNKFRVWCSAMTRLKHWRLTTSLTNKRLQSIRLTLSPSIVSLCQPPTARRCVSWFYIDMHFSATYDDFTVGYNFFPLTTTSICTSSTANETDHPVTSSVTGGSDVTVAGRKVKNTASYRFLVVSRRRRTRSKVL
jgi:hypothetical protein